MTPVGYPGASAAASLMDTRKKEKIVGWSIAAFGLLIALYGCAMELTAGISGGPNWGWLAAGIVLVFIGWLIGRYGWFLISGR